MPYKDNQHKDMNEVCLNLHNMPNFRPEDRPSVLAENFVSMASCVCVNVALLDNPKPKNIKAAKKAVRHALKLLKTSGGVVNDG